MYLQGGVSSVCYFLFLSILGIGKRALHRDAAVNSRNAQTLFFRAVCFSGAGSYRE